MAIQTTSLASKLDKLEQKASEYETRTNTGQRVEKARQDLDDLNRELQKLKTSLEDFERQAGILSQVFDEELPADVPNAREKVRTVALLPQDDILDIIDDSSRSLAGHVDEVRDTRELVDGAGRVITNQLKTVRQDKLSEAETAESIQKIVGEDPDAMDTISRYRSFLNSILNPTDSVNRLESQWQGLEKAFENLDTDWEGFRVRHDLSQQTIEDLKKLSREGKVDLDELSDASVTEMLDVPELRSTIKVSL